VCAAPSTPFHIVKDLCLGVCGLLSGQYYTPMTQMTTAHGASSLVVTHVQHPQMQLPLSCLSKQAHGCTPCNTYRRPHPDQRCPCLCSKDMSAVPLEVVGHSFKLLCNKLQRHN
jgi:hypothetical protein